MTQISPTPKNKISAFGPMRRQKKNKNAMSDHEIMTGHGTRDTNKK